MAIHRSANTVQNPRVDRRFAPSISDCLAPRSDSQRTEHSLRQNGVDVMHLKVRDALIYLFIKNILHA